MTTWPPFYLLASFFQADKLNHLIRQIAVSTGTVTTLAGRQGVSAPFSDGIGTVATFAKPNGIATNSDGSIFIVVSVAHRGAAEARRLAGAKWP